MAAAAAAGLLIGVASGRLVHFGNNTPAAPATGVARSAEPTRLAAERVGPAISTLTASAEPGMVEMNVLYGLDFAVSRPHVAELTALDELTPHPREVLMASTR